MKTKEKSIKGFKAVPFMREVRDKISNEIKDMNFTELKKYFEERSTEFQNEQKALSAKKGLASIGELGKL